MTIEQFKQHLGSVTQLNFVQPNGNFVPRHFHITEAGLTTKNFIDCGGTVRTEKVVSFQLWVAADYDHRLEPQKLQRIIAIAEPLFGGEDLEIEMEYQTETISRYGLEFNGHNFLLTPKHTTCLAQDMCGIPQDKLNLIISQISPKPKSKCTPGGGCC